MAEVRHAQSRTPMNRTNTNKQIQADIYYKRSQIPGTQEYKEEEAKKYYLNAAYGAQYAAGGKSAYHYSENYSGGQRRRKTKRSKTKRRKTKRSKTKRRKN